MTVTECIMINKLARYLCGNAVGDPGGIGHVSNEEALEACLFLVERSNKTLMAGIRPEQVRAAWPSTTPKPRSPYRHSTKPGPGRDG
jgi:hypothetical protein